MYFCGQHLLMLQNNWGRKGAQELPSLSSGQDQLGGQEQVAQAYLILEKLFFTISRNLSFQLLCFCSFQHCVLLTPAWLPLFDGLFMSGDVAAVWCSQSCLYFQAEPALFPQLHQMLYPQMCWWPFAKLVLVYQFISWTRSAVS